MDPAIETMVRNLEEKTGRRLEAWLELIRSSGVEKHGEIVKLLKTEHGFTHGYANLVAHAARGGLAPAEQPAEELENVLFTGGRSALRPVYELVRRAITGLGQDVEVSPKKTYVSFRRRKQFALVQPSTATRLDVGLNLKGVEPAGRLESAAGFNAMCTHRVRLESAEQVDAQLREWLRQAYEGAG